MAATQISIQDSAARLMLPPCRVCGDRAAGFHYGVNTCEACKGFFHRSLRRYKEYKCRANRTSGFCEYKPGKRKSCQYCRYQRCLNAGMSKEAIKTGRYTYLKRTEDTQEIKRLEDMEHNISSDGHDMDAMLVSSSFHKVTSKKSDIAELLKIDSHSETLMEVDSTTTEEFIASSVTENDHSCSGSDFSSTETHAVNSSLLSERRNQNNYDISFCLDGRPITSPASLMSDDVESPSVLISSATSQSPESNNNSPAPSPGMIMLNMDSGKRLKVSDDCDLVADLCHTPESRYPIGDEKLVHNEDNITLQIMEEYTKGLDLIIDSPIQIPIPTSVQALLTSPSPQELRSVSPQSSSGSDLDYLNESSPTSKLLNSVKNLKISDIPELYSDMDAVTAMLMTSHNENIGDFSFMSKEEMFAQQKAHHESCQLKKQTFGDLGLLSEQDYDDIYSITGIDVDNRRMMIQKYLVRMENCVRGLVQFAKTIPGFSILDINTQVELIKLARSEFAIFTVYPTVNLELGVSLGLSGEQWACQFDMGKIGFHLEEYMIFCDRLQKLAPTQEEEVLMKAILVVSPDRDNTLSSPLAEAIRWQLILCLKYSIEKHRDKPSLVLARYILILTQSRTVAEKFKDFFRQLKMRKYSSIEQNPLLWELYSGILQEKEGEVNWEKLCQVVRKGKAGLWSPWDMGYPVTL